jgi:hypothetical protein
MAVDPAKPARICETDASAYSTANPTMKGTARAPINHAPRVEGTRMSAPSCSQRHTLAGAKTVPVRSAIPPQPNPGTAGRTPAITRAMMAAPIQTATQSSLASKEARGFRASGGAIVDMRVIVAFHFQFCKSQTLAGPYGLGANTVTLTVTDTSGASDSCTATVTVVDGEDPTIACPVPQTVECTTGCS